MLSRNNDITVGTPTVLYLTEFGGKPDSGEDTVIAMQRAVEAASQLKGQVVLQCKKGRYDFYPEHAAKVPYYITNTASEEENADVTKTIGILFKGINNLILEGNDSLFMFHGKMTMIVMDSCENIEIRNLNTDWERATMSEMTVDAIESQSLDVRVLHDSWYEIKEGQLYWIGEDWRYQGGPSQEYDPGTNTTWRIPHPIMPAVKVEELEPYCLRFYYDGAAPETKVGNIFQLRDGIRDQVGAFILHSRNIKWIKVGMHYLHGLGIVCQFSENLSFEKMTMAPRSETRRTCAGFADFLHVSGCRGLVKVMKSHFEGAHDDAINVHGTHLRIVDKPSPNQVLVRFMHGQSYGFDAFFPGDTIDFVRARSLIVYDSNTIQTVERRNAREILLTLEKAAPDIIEAEDVIENVTWTPEVEIRNNRFARIPTRGILLSTRRKVVIENNLFERLAMSTILIADDAESWYESGKVRDVTIRGNFIESGSGNHPIIYINPENSEVSHDDPVHYNILIEENVIHSNDAPVLYAKSTRGLSFINNRIFLLHVSNKSTNHEHAFHLLACSDVKITGNTLVGDSVNKNLCLQQMSSENLTISAEQGMKIIPSW